MSPDGALHAESRHPSTPPTKSGSLRMTLHSLLLWQTSLSLPVTLSEEWNDESKDDRGLSFGTKSIS